MPYYKVVRRDAENKLISTAVSGMALVVYIPDEENRAPEWLAKQGYHLCVFSSLEAVDEYLPSLDFGGGYGYRLWEVEIGPQVKLPRRCALVPLHKGHIERRIHEWPFGTIMTETVKLLTDVTDEFIEKFNK